MRRYRGKMGLYTLLALLFVVTYYGCAKPKALDRPTSNDDIDDSEILGSAGETSRAGGKRRVEDIKSAEDTASSAQTADTGGKVDSAQNAGAGGTVESAHKASTGTGGKNGSVQRAGAGGKISSAQTPFTGGNTGSVPTSTTGGQVGSAQTAGAGGRIGPTMPTGFAGRFSFATATCDPKDSNTLSNCRGNNRCCTDDGRCGVSWGNSCRTFTQLDGGVFAPGDDAGILRRDAGFRIPNNSE